MKMYSGAFTKRRLGIVALLLAIALIASVFVYIPLNNSYAYTSSTVPASIGSLTLSDYAERDDGQVFDGEVLSKLYDAILGVQNVGTYQKVYDKVSDSVSSVTGTLSTGNTLTFPSSMNFSQINNGRAITVEFGGFKWNVVYLSLDNTSDKDLIATLWMSEIDSATDTYEWAAYSSTSTNVAYPTSMYSTSKMRLDVLNIGAENGDSYATSVNALGGTLTGDRTTHRYAPFTMTKDSIGKKSLYEYLAPINNLEYQRAESWIWSYRDAGAPYLMSNDAWGDVDDGIQGPDANAYSGTNSSARGWNTNGGGNTNNIKQIRDNPLYFDWVQDRLWLPSLTETGDSTTNAAASIWGINDTAIRSSAKNIWMRSGSDHTANLGITLVSNGDRQSSTSTNKFAIRPALHLNLTKAVKSVSTDNSGVQVTRNTEIPMPQQISEAIYDGNTHWLDYLNLPEGIKEPQWLDKTLHCNSDILEIAEILYSNVGGDVVNKDITSSGTEAIKDAGAYSVKLKIKDAHWNAHNYKWRGFDEQAITFNITINKKKITPRVELDSVTHVATLVSSGDILSGDTEANGRAPVYKIQFKRTGDGKIFDEPSAEKGNYQVIVTITNECNYEIAASAQFPGYVETGKLITLTKDDIIWLVDNMPLTGTEFNYRGSAYVFSISDKTADGTSLAERGVKIDISKGSDGYTGTYSAENASSNDYTVTVNLINLDDTYEDKVLAFTLTYRINRLNYDLSNTKWNYTSLIFNNAYQSVELENIPSGLKANYLGNSQINVSASGYTASVYSFDNTNPNYNTPTRGNTGSYDGDFDWELSWNISPYIIDFNWDNIAWTDKNGVSDFIPMLTNHDLLQDIITYKYYESDGQTEILLDDIEIDMGNVTVYFVDVILNSNFEGNYVLASEGNHKMFTLGKIRTGVSISITESSTVFDGSEKGATLKIGGNIPLKESDFIIKYYNADDDTPIEGLPINAGNYVIRVSLKEEHLDNYYILDNSPIRYSILQATIDLSGVHWNYDPDAPFQYQRKDGEALPYTVELIGLPEYLQNLVVYGGKYSGSSVDTYNATFDFVGLDTNNFVSFELPESIATKTLNWRIIPRAIPKPAYDGGELIFDNEDKDLFGLLNISPDWAEYFEITVRYNNAVADSFIAKDAGAYVVICNLLADLGNNVTWADGDVFAATAQFNVSPRIVTVNGWTNATIPAPQVDESELKFINQVYTDTNGASVEYGDIIKTFNSTFRVSLESAYGDNVIVRTAEEVKDWKEFSTPSDPNNPPEPIGKPELVSDKMQYNGSALTFELSGYDDTIMSISGSLTVTDLGEYTVTVRFKDGANYCWEDNTRDPVVLTFSVVEHLDDNPDNPGGNDPDGDNKGDSNGGGILDKIKDFFAELIENHFPLWQICTGVVAIILLLIFIFKTISYGNRKRAAKREAKKYNERSYTAAAAMLPIFAADEVLLGLSNKIWSIIAFALVGACVLMFIIMLLTRHSWKKAELAKEQAIEDDALRKAEADEAKQAAKEQEAQEKLLAMQRETEEARIAREKEAEETRLAREKEAEAKRIEREEELEAKRLAWQEEERAERKRQEERRLAWEEEERQERKRQEEMRAEMQKEMEAKRIAWEEAEEARRLARESEEREERRREEARREKRYREEYERREEELFRRDEAMKVMLASIMNRNMSDTPHFTEDIRTIVTEVVTAMMPTIQQQLAQSYNANHVAYIESAPISENAESAAAATEISSSKKQSVKPKRVKVDTVTAPYAEDEANISSVSETIAEEENEELDDDYVVDDEWDFDDEDWNDEDSGDIEGAESNKRKASCNFRQRLKLSSDKNRIYYAAVKNVFCAQRNVAYRVCGRVEKIKYHNELIAVIGVAKRSLKLWLALDPAQFDEERYYHKDVSDKPRFANVPMYVKVGSQRALNRVNELLAVLFEKFGIEAKRRYEEKPIQELIFTLRGNKLLKNKQNKALLCEVVHVHDTDVISDELAQTFIECKDIEPLEQELFANIKLDDIDAQFADGQKVTLDMLKKKGIVSPECNGYRVLAGSRVTKPLIIHANEIALSAVKMIALTGGRIIKLTQF